MTKNAIICKPFIKTGRKRPPPLSSGDIPAVPQRGRGDTILGPEVLRQTTPCHVPMHSPSPAARRVASRRKRQQWECGRGGSTSLAHVTQTAQSNFVETPILNSEVQGTDPIKVRSRCGCYIVERRRRENCCSGGGGGPISFSYLMNSETRSNLQVRWVKLSVGHWRTAAHPLLCMSVAHPQASSCPMLCDRKVPMVL